MIKLDLREMLPTIRKAFDNKELQMFTTKSSSTLYRCLYAGPCAIGACLSKEDQVFLDSQEHPSIHRLLTSNIVEAPENQHDDIVQLQEAHDRALHRLYDDPKAFEEILVRLEEKYL